MLSLPIKNICCQYLMQGGGYGELKIKLTYWPLELISGHAEARLGALIVTLLSAENLPIADIVQNSSDPFVTFNCAKLTKKSPILYSTCSPKWVDCKFEWFKIPRRTSVLNVNVFDYDRLSSDDHLGSFQIPVQDVAQAEGGDLTKTFTLDTSSHKMEPPNPEESSLVTLRLQWVPFKDL